MAKRSSGFVAYNKFSAVRNRTEEAALRKAGLNDLPEEYDTPRERTLTMERDRELREEFPIGPEALRRFGVALR